MVLFLKFRVEGGFDCAIKYMPPLLAVKCHVNGMRVSFWGGYDCLCTYKAVHVHRFVVS